MAGLPSHVTRSGNYAAESAGSTKPQKTEPRREKVQKGALERHLERRDDRSASARRKPQTLPATDGGTCAGRICARIRSCARRAASEPCHVPGGGQSPPFSPRAVGTVGSSRPVSAGHGPEQPLRRRAGAPETRRAAPLGPGALPVLGAAGASCPSHVPSSLSPLTHTHPPPPPPPKKSKEMPRTRKRAKGEVQPLKHAPAPAHARTHMHMHAAVGRSHTKENFTVEPGPLGTFPCALRSMQPTKRADGALKPVLQGIPGWISG